MAPYSAFGSVQMANLPSKWKVQKYAAAPFPGTSWPRRLDWKTCVYPENVAYVSGCLSVLGTGNRTDLWTLDESLGTKHKVYPFELSAKVWDDTQVPETPIAFPGIEYAPQLRSPDDIYRPPSITRVRRGEDQAPNSEGGCCSKPREGTLTAYYKEMNETVWAAVFTNSTLLSQFDNEGMPKSVGCASHFKYERGKLTMRTGRRLRQTAPVVRWDSIPVERGRAKRNGKNISREN